MMTRNTITPQTGPASAVVATVPDVTLLQPDNPSVKVSLSDQALAYLNQGPSSAAVGGDAAPAADDTPFQDLSKEFTDLTATFSKRARGEGAPLKPATWKSLLDYLMKSGELNAKEDARKKRRQAAAAVAAEEPSPMPTITAASIGAGR